MTLSAVFKGTKFYNPADGPDKLSIDHPFTDYYAQFKHM